MKEQTRNGPLMGQPRRQKGLQLSQISTVFGTIEDVLEQRTERSESNTSNNEDTRNGIMSGDVSGMVQDALFKARQATQALSPHNQSSGSKQGAYSSFFPSFEQMMSTTTMQHAQALLAGNTVSAQNAEGAREQPVASLKNETSVNRATAQPKPVRANASGKPSDFVIRKVEDEIANAKLVAQQAFNRVKGISGTTDVIDLTDANDGAEVAPRTTHHDRREMAESFSQCHQLGASSTWKSEGPQSTWRSEGAHSTWRSEGPLDSMMSEDYGLVYDYGVVANSMSSIGQQPTVFCSLDNPIIRVMEQNIIDLTNVTAEDIHFRAVSPEQASVTSVDMEANELPNSIMERSHNTVEASEKKKTGVRSYPILPVVKQSANATIPDSSVQTSDAKQAEIKTEPPATVADSPDSRAARLRKLRQPIMHIVKEDSHEDSQGTPEAKDTLSLDHEGGEDVENDQAISEDADLGVNENSESPQQELVTEVEVDATAAGKELEATDIDAVEEPVTDDQVEDALISSIETFQSTKEEQDTTQAGEASEDVKSQGSLEPGFNALIDLVDTADVADAIEDASIEGEEPSNAQCDEEENDATDGSEKLASGFNRLFSFFRDQDERNFARARNNLRDHLEKTSTVEPSKMQAGHPAEDAVVEVEQDATVSTKPEEPESALEEAANEATEKDEDEVLADPKEEAGIETEEEATAADSQSEIVEVEAEAKETLSNQQPQDADFGARALIDALGNFGATQYVDKPQAAKEAPLVDGEREVLEQTDNKSKNPLLAFFGAARQAKASDFSVLGLGFMEAKKNQAPTLELDGSENHQPYSENLNKSGESNEKNSLIEDGVSRVDTATESVEEKQMHSPLPSQYTADDEYCTEPGEDFHDEEADEEEHSNEVPAKQFDPLSSMYRPPAPEKQLEEGTTRVSLKDKYDEPPAEYSTRPTEDIINDNRVEAPIPQLSMLEPTDEIQKLQNSIMGESVTRRFNACGALKMFAMDKSNQLALARTYGFFDALIVALTTDLGGKDREAACGTRTRALEILLKISMPKENRVIIFYHPDLMESIVHCAIEDSGEIRMAACNVLAMLAKSGHLREPMAQVDGLLDVLSDSLLGVNRERPTPAEDEVHEKNANYSSDEYSSDTESSGHFSSSGSETSFEGPRGREKKKNIAALKQKELQEKKEETTKHITMSSCATLLHLSKQCAAGHFMCHNLSLLEALLILSQKFEHAMHSRSLEILCNLTRLPSNNEILAEHPSVVPVMLRLSTSGNEEDRVWALRMLQNISASKAGKQVLVSTFALELLSLSILRAQAEEQKAAMATLFNLSTDPGCLMAITNTRDVLSSLVLVAQDMNIMSDVRMMACDTLATIGLWFQRLASTSTVPDGVKEKSIPSHATFGWNRWI